MLQPHVCEVCGSDMCLAIIAQTKEGEAYTLSSWRYKTTLSETWFATTYYPLRDVCVIAGLADDEYSLLF